MGLSIFEWVNKPNLKEKFDQILSHRSTGDRSADFRILKVFLASSGDGIGIVSYPSFIMWLFWNFMLIKHLYYNSRRNGQGGSNKNFRIFIEFTCLKSLKRYCEFIFVWRDDLSLCAMDYAK